jgi:hypothetical protein
MLTICRQIAVEIVSGAYYNNQVAEKTTVLTVAEGE